MKKHYNTPVIEEVTGLLNDVILETSGDATRSDYGTAEEFEW
jgi:hypothetical protein